MSSDPRIGALPKTAYSAYIQSAQWRKKRQQYIASKLSNDCAGCDAPFAKGFHLHHRSYKNLGVERLMDLVMLCPNCHDAVHESSTPDLWRHTKKTLRKLKSRTC